eukprot:g1889.t1
MLSIRHVKGLKKALSFKANPLWIHSIHNRQSNFTRYYKHNLAVECQQGDSAVSECKYKALPNDQKHSIDLYVDYLLQENKKYNLTGLNTFDECIEQIVDDTAALLPFVDKHLEPRETIKLVDVGSGAGIPGIPISIMRPDWKIVCIESTHKKCNFIQEVITLCKLANVEVIRGRCEEIAKQEHHRERYDVVVSRGVASFPVLLEYCLPFLMLNGLFIAPKGSQVEMEVNSAQSALTILGGELISIEQVDSQGTTGQRTAILTRKIKPTPSKYPRRPGLPTKRPL